MFKTEKDDGDEQEDIRRQPPVSGRGCHPSFVMRGVLSRIFLLVRSDSSCSVVLPEFLPRNQMTKRNKKRTTPSAQGGCHSDFGRRGGGCGHAGRVRSSRGGARVLQGRLGPRLCLYRMTMEPFSRRTFWASVFKIIWMNISASFLLLASAAESSFCLAST